jgi:hypothetical protein
MEALTVNPPEKVLSLVEVFERNADEYLSAHFSERSRLAGGRGLGIRGV